MARTYKAIKWEKSPKNQLNLVVTVEVLEDGQPVIEPTTGRPLVIQVLGDDVGDNLAYQCGVQEQALAIRKQIEAKQADQIAKIEAIIAAGGIVTPAEIKQPTAAELAYADAVRKLSVLQSEVNLKIIPDNDPAYLAAVQVAKDAKAALATVEPKVK